MNGNQSAGLSLRVEIAGPEERGQLRPAQEDHARLEAATYREIANTLFDLSAMSARSWKTHDLRDQAILLARLGNRLMLGGYRDLLLHPYRRRP